MSSMKFYNVNTPPKATSPEGMYYVKDSDDTDKINVYLVSGGKVKKQEDSKERIIQLTGDLNIIENKLNSVAIDAIAGVSITERVTETNELAIKEQSTYFNTWGAFYGWSSIMEAPDILRSVTFNIFNNETTELTQVRLIITQGGWDGKISAFNIIADLSKSVSILAGTDQDITIQFDKPLQTNSRLITIAYVCDKKTKLLSIPPVNYIYSGLTGDYRIKASNFPSDKPNFLTLSENTRAAWIQLNGDKYRLNDDQVTNVESRLTKHLPDDYKALFEGDRQTVELVNVGIENIAKSKMWYFQSYGAYNGFGQKLMPITKLSAISFIVNPDQRAMSLIRCQIRKNSIVGEILADETLQVNISQSVKTTIDWFFDAVDNSDNEDLYFMYASDVPCGRCGPTATDFPQPPEGMWFSRPTDGLNMKFNKYSAPNESVMWVQAGETRYQLNQNTLDNIAERLNLTPASYRVNLPDKIYTVVGDTLQLFIRGFVHAINPYDLDIWSENLTRKRRYFEITPTTAGNTNFNVLVRDVAGNILGSGTTVIETKAVVKSPATLKVAGSLGDSNSMNGVWQGEALRRLIGTGGSPSGNGLSNIEFKGRLSRTYEGITYGYDGIGGVSWDYWAGNQSPYWDADTNDLNFKKYVDMYMGGQVDVMYCMLSWNGVAARQNDFSQWITLGKKIVDNMHSSYPNMKFVLMGIHLPNLNFAGDATKNRTDWVGMIEAIFNMNEAYQSWCNENGYKDFMQFLNISAIVDSEYNSSNATKPVNTRNTTTEIVGMDSVHPANSGYYQIGDGAYRNFVANFCQ